MFRLTSCLAVLVGVGHVAASPVESPILNVTATTSSTISGFDRLAVYAVDGSGLVGDTHTSVASGNMWQGGAGLSTFTIDLRRVYDLTELKVWNYNEISSPHGVKAGHIDVSLNGTDWDQVIADQPFTEAPHTNGYDTPDDVPFPVNTQARYLRLSFTEIYASRSGLSEVQVSGMRVLPVVPGFNVEVYANVTDPRRLTFDNSGNLFVGRDNAGSGGHNQDPVRIHRVAIGGSPVAEYGNDPIDDPDAVLFDPTGAISGSPGSILVGGRRLSDEVGRISAILPDESVADLLSVGHGTNPIDMAFDSTDRLIFADSNQPGRILASTGVEITELYNFGSERRAGALAVDPLDRIFVALDDGTISVHASDGSLLDPGFATGLAADTALAFGPGGAFGNELYIQSDGSLLRYDDLGNSTIVGTGFESVSLGGIEFGPDGSLYVSEFLSDQVLRVAIPEPSALVLLSMGAVALLAYARRRRHQL